MESTEVERDLSTWTTQKGPINLSVSSIVLKTFMMESLISCRTVTSFLITRFRIHLKKKIPHLLDKFPTRRLHSQILQ